jgi:hypothetical protein
MSGPRRNLPKGSTNPARFEVPHRSEVKAGVSGILEEKAGRDSQATKFVSMTE